MAMVLHRGL